MSNHHVAESDPRLRNGTSVGVRTCVRISQPRAVDGASSVGGSASARTIACQVQADAGLQTPNVSRTPLEGRQTLVYPNDRYFESASHAGRRAATLPIGGWL